jgi:hypothetical protein
MPDNPVHLIAPALHQHLLRAAKDTARRHGMRAEALDKHNHELKSHMDQAKIRARADRDTIRAQRKRIADLEAKLKAAGIEP